MTQPRKKGQPRKGWKDAARKTHEQPIPTENQMDHALAAFARSKVRYKLIQIGERHCRVMIQPDWAVEATITGSFAPSMPETSDIASQTMTYREFPDEASARQWREREIIREAITAGMRAKA